MIRRLLRVWMFAFALLESLAVMGRLSAKPPDLPVDPNSEVAPVVAPMTPFDFVTPAAYVAPPSPSAPMETPETITIYHPVRPNMPLSVQREFGKCILFGAHPLLSLVPMADWIEEEHTQEVIPIAPMPPVTTGILLFGVGVNCDAGITGICYEFHGTVQVAPTSETPCPPKKDEQPPASVCPWMCPPACDRHVPAIADVEMSRTVMQNLESLVEAEKLYQRASKLVNCGQYAKAMQCLNKVCRLCPGSRFEEMSGELVAKIVYHLWTSGSDDEAGVEEEEDYPPTQCLPIWTDDPELQEPTAKDMAHAVKAPVCPCHKPCCKAPGVAEQVAGLMKACHLALSCGCHQKAAELAREAYALDAERVAADPVVYKMHLLALNMDKGNGCCEGCAKKDCCCPNQRVEMVRPGLPPVDAGVVLELQELLTDEEVANAKPQLEVIEEESECREVPKAMGKPFCVRSSKTGDVLSADELLLFLPGETWTEFDATTNHLRVLWRVHVGGMVYRLRYDGGDLSFYLTVLPSPGGTTVKPKGGGCEHCEGPR
jgi:hypothetical protein